MKQEVEYETTDTEEIILCDMCGRDEDSMVSKRHGVGLCEKCGLATVCVDADF